MAMFKEAADIKTSDQLHLPVPDAKFETVVVKPSEIQQDMVQALSERAAEVHSGSVDPSVDNMLKITSDGRKIGLDQRLMNSALPDDPNSKLNACVNNVLRIWNDTKEQKLTQLIFCDMSTPKGDGSFNVYAAKNAQTTQAVEFNGSSEDLKLNVVYGAAHGTKCFTSGAVATAGDTIVLSYIDEFQFAGSDAGVVGVPNSDSDFGAGYAEGKVLMSKRVNADYYSKMMAEKAGSTVSLDANYDAIQNHVNGMSIADAEALSKDEKAVDAVSGATLVDTAGYVGVLVDAAK